MSIGVIIEGHYLLVKKNKIERNELCPCGRNKKFKKYCENLDNNIQYGRDLI